MPESIYRLDKGGIYNIINAVTLKHYIGSAKRFQDRWYTHKSRLNRNKHDNRHLQAAWNKYGPDVFTFVVIEYVDDPASLTVIEQLYLDGCWRSGKLYNLNRTAESRLGMRHSRATRQKLTEAHKGKKRGPHSEQTRKKISLALMGKTKGKVSPMKGKHMSEESRRKLSESHKGKDNHCRGRIVSESTRRKISEAFAKKRLLANLA